MHVNICLLYSEKSDKRWTLKLFISQNLIKLSYIIKEHTCLIRLKWVNSPFSRHLVSHFMDSICSMNAITIIFFALDVIAFKSDLCKSNVTSYGNVCNLINSNEINASICVCVCNSSESKTYLYCINKIAHVCLSNFYYNYPRRFWNYTVNSLIRTRTRLFAAIKLPRMYHVGIVLH